MEKVRVRFAPSPTGTLHIGGARTALFNWLYARHYGGYFILRLEDTDTLRSTQDSAAGILEGLQWLGLNWDEGPDIGGPYGPYRQSERLSIYQNFLQQLLDTDQAYYCFCSPEALNNQREKAQLEKRNFLYDGRCRELTNAQQQELMAQGYHPVVRLKIPPSGYTVVTDLIRGRVDFDNSLLDDFIIAKSDGWPTYNFAVVIDDHTMKVSHVIRAEEHLSNTPKQLLIYDALGINPPQFAHVSMILAPDRSKLSKRHGATSVQEFRDEGYLPEALRNYLALLGWSPGENQDIFPWEEMPPNFNLDDVSRSPAVYDIKKLAWMNGHYISIADLQEIIILLQAPAQERGWLKPDNSQYFAKVVDLVRSRARTVNEILDLAEYFFEEPDRFDEKGVGKYFLKSNGQGLLEQVLNAISELPVFDGEQLEELIRTRAEMLSLKASDLIHPTRLALSGRTTTPGLFEVMEILGPETCANRIRKAINYIGTLS